jgi:hypothetical protein
MYPIFLKLRDLAETSPAKHDQIVFVSLIATAILNVALWLAVVIGFWHFNDYVILQYNMYFGISSFGAWYWLLLLPVAGLLAAVFDVFLSFNLYLEYRILSRALAVSAVLLNVILLSVVGLLIYMNM